MKIAFLTNIPAPYKVNFFDYIGKQVDVTVFFEALNASYRDESWKLGQGHSFRAEILTPLFRRRDVVFCPSIVKRLRKGEFERIIVSGYSTLTEIWAICWLHFYRIPFVLSVDGGVLRKKESKLAYYIKKWLVSKAGYWLSSGRKTDEYLVYYGAQSEKIFHYPFSSIRSEDVLKKPYDEKSREKIREKIGITEKKVILAVGQFIPRKGFDILLKAFQGVPEGTGLYIVGGKATREYIEIQEENQLKNVHYIDFLQPDDIKKYYLAANIFVLPTREDIWGLVINEAAAYALPIITTEGCVAGVELIEDGKNGYIIPVDDVKELSVKMRILLENDALRCNMREEILKTASGYTIEKMGDGYLEALKSME